MKLHLDAVHDIHQYLLWKNIVIGLRFVMKVIHVVTKDVSIAELRESLTALS